MCVSSHRHRQRGLTLIELVMFIVIVTVGIAGILVVINTVVKSSADPMLRKQSIAMADAVLEEVLLKAYVPSAVYDTTIPAICASPDRSLMDDVSDYDCFDGTTALKKILGSQMIASAGGPLPDTFWAKVEVPVVLVAVSGVNMKKVTVTMTDPSGATYALSAYRADY